MFFTRQGPGCWASASSLLASSAAAAVQQDELLDWLLAERQRPQSVKWNQHVQFQDVISCDSMLGASTRSRAAWKQGGAQLHCGSSFARGRQSSQSISASGMGADGGAAACVRCLTGWPRGVQSCANLPGPAVSQPPPSRSPTRCSSV